METQTTSKWSKANWLITLYSILFVVIIIYTLSHNSVPGDERLALDPPQTQTLNNLIDYFKLDVDTYHKQEILTGRKKAVCNYLTEACNWDSNEFETDFCSKINNNNIFFIDGLDNKDLKTYISNHKFLIKNYFWLDKSKTYLEVIFWALIGVLTSLVFYVSMPKKTIVNTDTNKEEEEDEDFDPTEIAGQVSKLVYAPIVTLVLVICYNIINSNYNVVDISVGKGTILFSFIAGFYSGRLMKLLDKIKDLILPDNPSKKNTTTNDSTAIKVTAKISFSNTYKNISSEDLKTAVVLLHPETGADITFKSDATGYLFTTDATPFGKYTLKATCNYTPGDGSPAIKLSATDMPIELKADTKEIFELILDKSKDNVAPPVDTTTIKATAKISFTDTYKAISIEDLKTAIVLLHPEIGADITLKPDATGYLFTADAAPFGKYTLKATCNYTPKDGTIVIKLTAPDKPIEISANTKEIFELVLDKSIDDVPQSA